MSFIGKFAYLVLFPGLVFVALLGTVARGLLLGMEGAVTGEIPEGPAMSFRSTVRLSVGEWIRAGNDASAVQWIAPAVRLLALSWVTCAVFGFFPADLVLVYSLLVLASASDLLICFTSTNARQRQNGRTEIATATGWAIPFAFVVAGVSLRTGTVAVSGLVSWQSVNGVLLGSTAGGALQLAGTWVLFLVALMCAVSLMRLKPFAGGYFDDAPGGLAWDTSGPPLALMRFSEAASFFVIPLLLVAFFLAGPASNWYEIVFWGLKVTGLFMLLGVFDMVSAKLRSDRVLLWLVGAGTAIAIAGLLLVRFGRP